MSTGVVPDLRAPRVEPGEFDVGALLAAIEAKREAEGLSWAEVGRQVSGRFGGTAARPVSVSTIRGMKGRRVVEGDGLLQMLLWLDRAPESFLAGARVAERLSEQVPEVPRDRILRWDARALHAALDRRRAECGLSWTALAREIGGDCVAANLTRLAKGGRVCFPDLMRITRWLDRPAATFTHVCTI